jgi:CopG family nickel-responsive transcriptional regulator
VRTPGSSGPLGTSIKWLLFLKGLLDTASSRYYDLWSRHTGRSRVSDLERLSFSLERSLLARLEKLRKEGGYDNRSEFLRDMIRGRLVDRAWELDKEAVGAITLVYDHHTRGLNEKLTDLQHDHHAAILATTHVHLDHHHCVEVILVRGRAGRIRAVADLLQKQKGVLHGGLSVSSTGKELD